MSLDVFGNGGELEGFVQPERDGDDFVVKDHVGATLVLSIVGAKTVKTKAYGEKDAIECDVAVIGDDGSVTEYPDSLIFSTAIVGQLRKMAGRTMAATIEAYQSDYGTTGYKLGEPNAKQLAAAKAATSK